MTGPVVGTVAVDVVPSTRNFPRQLRDQLVPQASKVGDEFGKAMSERIKARLGDAIKDPIEKQSAPLAAKGALAGDKFGRAMRERIYAALKDLPKANIDADTSPAERQLALLRKKLAITSGQIRLGRLNDSEALAQIKNIQAQLAYLAKSTPDIRVRVNAGAAQAELAKLYAELGLVDKKTVELDSHIRKAGKVGFKPLMDPILQLVPAAILLLGALSAAVATAAVGAAAFYVGIKGIQDQIKAGTPLGNQYAAMVNRLKTNFTQLKTTGAQTLLASFKSGFGDVQKLMPTLNNDVKIFGNIAGQVASHVLVGLIAGFHTLTPLLEQIGASFVRQSKKFESFSSGTGLANFASTVSSAWPKITAAFGQLGDALIKVFKALEAAGNAGLTVIGALSKLINALPLPVLTALVSGLLAARLAFLALGVASKIAGIELIKTPYGAIAVGLTALVGGLAAAAGGFGKLFDKVRNFGSSNIFDSQGNLKITGDPAAPKKFGAGDRVADAASGLNKLASFDLPGFFGSFGKSGRQKQIEQASKDAAQLTKDISVAIAKGTSSAVPEANKNIAAATSKITFKTDLTGTGASIDTAASNIQTLIDRAQALDGVGGGTQKVIGGISYSADELSAALKLTNNNMAAAVGLLHANQTAGDLYATSLRKIQLEQTLLNSAIDTAASKFKLTSDQVSQYATLTGITGKDLATGRVNAYDFATAIGAVAKAFGNANAVQSEFLAASATFGQSAGTAADRGALISATLKLANGDLLAYQGAVAGANSANVALVSGFQAESDKIIKLRDQIGKGKLDTAQLGVAQRALQRDLKGTQFAAINLTTGMIDTSKAGAGPLITALQGVQDAALAAASATFQHNVATEGGKKAADEAYKVYVSQTRGALIDEASQLGLTDAQAKKFADRYFGLANAPDIKKKIEAIGTDPVVTVLKDIRDLLQIIAGLKPKPTVAVDTGDSIPAMDRLAARLAALHDVTINVVTRESSLSVPGAAVSGRPAQTGAYGNLIKAYGYGGVENHIPQIASTRPGTVRVWAEPETGGEAYIPLANDSRRPRARAIAKATVAMLGGIAAFATGGVSAATAARQAATLNRQRADIRFKVDSIDFAKLIAALTGPTASLATVTRALVTDLHNAVNKGIGSTNLVNVISTENAALLRMSTQRASIANKLKDANAKLTAVRSQFNAEVSTVSQAVRGSFDITNAGQQSNGVSSAETIIRSLSIRAANARTFTAQLAALRKKGLSASAVRQLAEAGPDQAGTNVAALAGASSAQIKQFNSLFGNLFSTGNAAGKAQADQMFGAGVRAAQGVVAGLKSQDAALTKAMKHLADIMVAQIKRSLKIHSPSEVGHELGAYFGLGLANGVASHESTVRNAADSLVAAVNPGQGAGVGGAVPVVYVSAWLDGEAIDHRADVRIEHHSASEVRSLLAGRV